MKLKKSRTNPTAPTVAGIILHSSFQCNRTAYRPRQMMTCTEMPIGSAQATKTDPSFARETLSKAIEGETEREMQMDGGG